MLQNCQSKSFQHNETNTVSDSLSVYCHSSSYRYSAIARPTEISSCCTDRLELSSGTPALDTD